jgi:hypothetical protein
MNKKSKPSLYRGDYYTIEEYRLLAKFLGSSLISFIIKNYLCNGASSVKRHIHIYKDVSGANLYDLIYNTILDNVPLFLNEDNEFTSVCQWRLQINK